MIKPISVVGDREIYEVQGSAKDPYKITKLGEVWSCSCIAWRNQSQPINKRTCKHIRKIRGDAAEQERLGGSVTMKAAKTKGKVTAVPPALLLAEKFDPDKTDPTGYWMSEKLDGVRAYWDGKNLISRLGNPFYPPEWFIKDFPEKVKLDGELFIGRKRFQDTVSIVRSQGLDKEWKEIKYLVFDTPSEKGTFEQRLGYLDQAIADCHESGIEHVQLVEHERCESLKHLFSQLKKVEKLGAEGLMLREPGSLYEGHRSSTLLKVKTFLDDEATVTGTYEGKGRHEGRIGGVELLWKGKYFRAGTGFSDKERENPPKIGTKVTFRYQELSKDGIPRFPVYAGPAIDK